MARYKSVHTGPQIDSGVARALPGGAIDLSLSNKVDKACGLPSGTDLNDVVDPNEYVCEFDDSYLNFPVVTNAYSLSVHKITSYALYQIFRPFHVDTIYFRRKYSGGWHDWLQIATSTPPTEYDLPLASGWSGTLKYFKTQENVCIVTGALTKDSQFSTFEVFGALPAGYKPATSASYPAAAFASHTSLSITAADNGQLSLGDVGGLTTQRVLFFNISFVAGN